MSELIKQKNTRKEIVLGWIRIVCGLLVFSFGVHLTIYANIGLAPWDCLGMGIAKHTPLNYGLSMTCIALTVLLIDILLKVIRSSFRLIYFQYIKTVCRSKTEKE